MRKAVFFAFLALCGGLSARADVATRDLVERYFASWYSVCPGTKVSAVEVPEVAIPGYDAYKTERSCQFKNRNDSNITLVDRARQEIFVGQVLHDGSRRGRPFSAAADLPTIRGAVGEAFGLPASVFVGMGARGALIPLDIRIPQAPGAAAILPGFVSQDGAVILLGEFFPLREDPAAMRERLLAEPAGGRGPKTSFSVPAFIDFQCEKCRQRTPQVRDFVWTHGGALQVRFLPLVKVHDWAFAAAESAAALANMSPSLYAKYEEAIFPRASTLNEKAVRDLALDVAESAGARAAFETELSSGRARERVLKDINLALRLCLNGTPVFFYRGTFLTAEQDLAENYIQGRLTESAKSSGKGSSR